MRARRPDRCHGRSLGLVGFTEISTLSTPLMRGVPNAWSESEQRDRLRGKPGGVRRGAAHRPNMKLLTRTTLIVTLTLIAADLAAGSSAAANTGEHRDLCQRIVEHERATAEGDYHRSRVFEERECPVNPSGPRSSISPWWVPGGMAVVSVLTDLEGVARAVDYLWGLWGRLRARISRKRLATPRRQRPQDRTAKCRSHR